MMVAKRIVSFLPSATELLYELGCQKNLYGVTHECLYPEEAKSIPRVITTVINGKVLSSEEIDRQTCKLMKEGKDIFVLDKENLVKASPDLIISQNTCEVCAAHTNQVQQAIEILEKKPEIHSIDPHNLQQILESVEQLAKILEKEVEGKNLSQSLRNRINFVKNHKSVEKPKVLAIEWVKPFFTSGHWIPEMVEIAGGINLISKSGEHSRRIDINEIKDANPDLIVLMPCGFDTKRTILEYEKFLKEDNNWKSLRAVHNGNVFAVDANSYFSKPSIRTITGLEILAKIIHPEIFGNLKVPDNSFEKIE